MNLNKIKEIVNDNSLTDYGKQLLIYKEIANTPHVLEVIASIKELYYEHAKECIYAYNEVGSNLKYFLEANIDNREKIGHLKEYELKSLHKIWKKYKKFAWDNLKTP
jgi:hypothetical protein